MANGDPKHRHHVHVRTITMIIETDEGAFMHTVRVDKNLMCFQDKGGVMYKDSDNVEVTADIRFRNKKFIEQPAGWIFKERPHGQLP